MNMFSLPRAATGRCPPKPVVGMLCCNEYHDRAVQAVASRFVEPLTRLSGAAVVLVPAMIEACDAATLTRTLDGLLLTGSRSNVAAERYGGATGGDTPCDAARDAVALSLAASMIEAGKPVFGICRGLQELNVLFGGTLSPSLPGDLHHRREDGVSFDALFEHDHDVELVTGGLLARHTGADRARVNSVHYQGVDRLGSGLQVEALASDDGLVEAFSARPCGGPVMAVQWHPEWGGAQRASDRAFFDLFGGALRERVAA